MTTSKLIKSLRKSDGSTQKQFAEKIKVEQPRISEWENGKHNISIDKFFEICKILNVEPKSIIS